MSIDSLSDSIRGMFLLGVYGDALGADHEGSSTVASPPFNKLLPVVEFGEASPWRFWLPGSVVPRKAGVPTDDSCYRFFILHPWLKEVANQNSHFDESSFREFLPELKGINTTPDWIQEPRNEQIDAWLAMFRAQPRRNRQFYSPDSPVVFGLFMYLETAVAVSDIPPTDLYSFYRRFAILDQSYAKSSTAFLATLTNLAIASNPNQETFDVWFFRESLSLLKQLQALFPLDVDLLRLQRLVETMQTLGHKFRGKPEHEFAIAFKEQVLDPDHPPFMMQALSKWNRGTIDPFRFLAQIVATIEFSAGDPTIALRTIAYSTGDTDTTATFLGTLMGAWYGEKELRRFSTPDFNFSEQLDLVEDCLTGIFGIDLNERVELFKQLRHNSLINQL